MSKADPFDNPEIMQRALKQVRALCHGNGAPPDSVQIQKVSGEIIKCEAINHLEIHTEVQQERREGQIQAGQTFDHPAKMEKAIQNDLKSALKNDEIRKFMANTLLERKDKGFSLHGKFFDLPPLSKEYSYHEVCGQCQGNARVACGRCGGQQYETCNVCHARGMTPCNHCHGSGFQQGPDGKQRQCTYCNGQRQVICPTCQKRGKIRCRACKGSGANLCDTCKGKGSFTFISKVLGQMKTLFEMDRAALPHSVVKIFEDKGDKVAASGHMKLNAEQVKREDGGLAIQYNCEFPYAQALININGHPIKADIFGFKGKMIKINNFLEDLVAPQILQLQEATQNGKSAEKNIRKASKSKLIGMALTGCLSMPPKQVVKMMKKKYPMAIRTEKLVDIVNLSKKSLAKLTQRARWSGFILAGTINAIMTWLYFTTNIRNPLSGTVGLNGLMVLDLLLIPLGGFLGSLATNFMAKRPIQKALGHITKNINAKKMVVWPNYAISAGVFVAVVLALKFTGQTPPRWLPF